MDPVVTRKPPILDTKAATVNADDLWKVDEVFEPDSGWPGDPTLKLKGRALVEDTDYTRDSGKITFVHPKCISIYATLELFDGSTVVWRWTAAGGPTVGG